jgi:hypothetical protein
LGRRARSTTKHRGLNRQRPRGALQSSSGKGLFTRKMFSAEVVLGDIDPSAVEASVTLDSFGREEDPTDIVAFVPMVVAAVRRACRNAPEVAAPFVGLCSEIGELLSAVGPDECRLLNLRDRLGLTKVGVWLQSDPESILRVGIPKVTGDPGPRPHRKLRADLKLQERSGVPFVQIHSANAYIAAMGTAALFEHIAQTQHYRTVTAPMAGSVPRMLELAEELGARAHPKFRPGDVAVPAGRPHGARRRSAYLRSCQP